MADGRAAPVAAWAARQVLQRTSRDLIKWQGQQGWLPCVALGASGMIMRFTALERAAHFAQDREKPRPSGTASNCAAIVLDARPSSVVHVVSTPHLCLDLGSPSWHAWLLQQAIHLN